MSARPVTLLIADDDPEDRAMLAEVFAENEWVSEIKFVTDGEELLDYLENRGKFADAEKHPRPDLVLLDLNMPKKDGREALAEVRSNPNFTDLPVVILTTSKAEEDIVKTSGLGANSFITKPDTFDGLVSIARDLRRYWVKTIR